MFLQVAIESQMMKWFGNLKSNIIETFLMGYLHMSDPAKSPMCLNIFAYINDKSFYNQS